jgi:hypothetical protein
MAKIDTDKVGKQLVYVREEGMVAWECIVGEEVYETAVVRVPIRVCGEALGGPGLCPSVC